MKTPSKTSPKIATPAAKGAKKQVVVPQGGIKGKTMNNTPKGAAGMKGPATKGKMK